MPIPKSRSEVVIEFVVIGTVVGFALLAVVNLCSGVALIASFIWLTFVTAMIWSSCRREGGVRPFIISMMGDLFGRCFAEWSPAEEQPKCIRFGFQLFRRRFVQQSIRIDRIESVEWHTGQATDMAKRDMNDWHVWVWFSHDDPSRTEARRKWHRKPDQDLYGVGPTDRKERTEALGLSFVSFLRSAGADLVQGAITTCFVRAPGIERKSIQQDAAPNSRPPFQLPTSPENRSSDSLRTPSSGGCG